MLNLLIDQCILRCCWRCFHFALFFNSHFQSKIVFAADKMSLHENDKAFNSTMVCVRACVCAKKLHRNIEWKSAYTITHSHWVISTSDQTVNAKSTTKNALHTTLQFTYNYLCNDVPFFIVVVVAVATIIASLLY